MSQNNKITVLQIEPKKFPKVITIDNELRSLQAEVGGLIECIDITDDITLICNEEGKLMNDFELNRAIKDNNNQIVDIIAGNILIASFDSESGEFCSLSPEQMQTALSHFKYPEVFFKHNNQIYAISCDSKLIQTSPVDLAFVTQDGTMKETLHFNNEQECFFFGFMVNQLYLEVANANFDELEFTKIQPPYDISAYEKILENAVDPFSDEWDEDVEI